MKEQDTNAVENYRSYIAACNDRRLNELGRFVAADVAGVRSGVDSYREGIEDVIAAFPDFQWKIEDVVVGSGSLAVRLEDSGTHRGTFGGIAATGRRITVQELAIYRISEGKIVHCWGDLDTAVRSALLPPDTDGGHPRL